MTGYLDGSYAAALAEFGDPLALPATGGWALARSIAGSSRRDAMGCYPLFGCARWSALPEDMAALAADGLVSLTLVTDPFGEFTADQLQRWFDRAALFKQHYCYDLEEPREQVVAKNHRRNARQCLKKAHIEIAARPIDHLDEWTRLYGFLTLRHELRGIKAFSRQSFARQLAVPGLTMLRVVAGGHTVAAQLWYSHGEVAYSHLTAGDPESYRLDAAYGLYWTAIEYFRGRVRFLDLGAGAGLAADPSDGLAVFKRGFARHSRPVYLCGKIFDRAAYEELTRARGAQSTAYFPAYRSGELA